MSALGTETKTPVWEKPIREINKVGAMNFNLSIPQAEKRL